MNITRAMTVALVGASMLTLLLSQNALAQSNPSLPGAILEHSKDPLKDPEKKGPKSVEQTPQESLEESQKEAPDIKDETPKYELDPSLNVKFFIRQIEVEGANHLDAEEVRQVVAQYENRESTLAELQDNISDALTKLYEQKGYVTTLVYIPPQKIEDGVLKVKADEGIVSRIVYEEGRYFRKRAVLPRLLVEEGEIFDLQELQKSMRRINENPDVNLQATLRAGEEPGQTDIFIKPEQENFPVHFTPFFDNLGRPAIGRNRLGFTLNNNNLLGFGDTLLSNFAFSTDSFSIINGYELPVGSRGTKIGFSKGLSFIDFEAEGFDFDGDASLYVPYISQELYRSEKWVVGAELALAIKNSQLDVNDTQISDDQLTVIQPALKIQRFGETNRTIMRHELGIGLDIFGASNNSDTDTSRPGAGSQFFRYTGSLLSFQKLPKSTYGLFKFLYQYTPDQLVSLEQFQVGGAATVRGYQEGRVLGDSGFVLSAEWHLPAFFLPGGWHLPGTNYRLRDNIELVSFVDFGGVFDNDAFSGVNPASGRIDSNAFLASTGVGLRARLTRLLTARLDLAFPLISLSPNTNTARLHFGLESRWF